MDSFLLALGMVFRADVLLAMLAAGVFGLFVGAIPGLTATMATALLVPITFFLSPVVAVACIVTAVAMAIFAGDIPGCLLRIPGTPASAAYTNEAYAMTRKGEAEKALGICLVFSAIGGLFGTAVLITSSPLLAEVALKFSSYEYFWLVLLGLTCAVFVSTGSVIKGLIALFLGLLLGTVGIQNPAAHPRYTFGSEDLLGGFTLVPALIGLFAISEVLRFTLAANRERGVVPQVGSVFKGMGRMMREYPWQTLRGSVTGTAVGVVPGAGADIAAWISFTLSKKLSKTPEKFGTGHPEGLVEAGASNNSSLSSAWIPALVFGIPGDSITAIVIGVLYMKNMNPGPMIFVNNPENVYAIFIIFVLANLLMIPLGWACIKASARMLRIPANILMPIILMFCIVGAFAINNSMFDVALLVGFGLLGWLLEENGFPIAPVILGMLLGQMLEENFLASMIKSDGAFMSFVDRPVAGCLAAVTALIWSLTAWFAWKRWRGRQALLPATPVNA